jgi:hypothetical protein
MSDDILRQEIDGVGYFTIASTGESGMSQNNSKLKIINSKLKSVGLVPKFNSKFFFLFNFAF